MPVLDDTTKAMQQQSKTFKTCKQPLPAHPLPAAIEKLSKAINLYKSRKFDEDIEYVKNELEGNLLVLFQRR